MGKLLVIAVMGLGAGCASQTKLSSQARAAVHKAYRGKIVELRHTSYYGNLYDENEKYLISQYPFDKTHHIAHPDGTPIHPTGQMGIIPAGTRFVVQKVEFPSPGALVKRMLTTPRYNPWVYLYPVEGEPIPRDRTSYIALLPMDMSSEEQTRRAMSAILAPDGHMQHWLKLRRPTVRKAILRKEVIEGMNQEELLAAMGYPMMWIREGQGKSDDALVAWYNDTEYWLKDNRVVKVKEGRSEAQADAAASRGSSKKNSGKNGGAGDLPAPTPPPDGPGESSLFEREKTPG